MLRKKDRMIPKFSGKIISTMCYIWLIEILSNKQLWHGFDSWLCTQSSSAHLLFCKLILKPFPLLRPGEANRSSRQQKESKRSVQRMKFLESYCDKLLKCDAAVTQSPEVRQFFMPKDHDLQPDFTKNRWVCHVSVGFELLCESCRSSVLNGTSLSSASWSCCPTTPPAEEGAMWRAASPTRLSPRRTAAWQPMRRRIPRIARSRRLWTRSWTSWSKTLQVSAVAFHAALHLDACKNLFTLFAVMLKVLCFCSPSAGWWLVENEDKRLAWFPAPYLELWEGEEDDDDAGFQLGGAIFTPTHCQTEISNLSLITSLYFNKPGISVSVDINWFRLYTSAHAKCTYWTYHGAQLLQTTNTGERSLTIGS